MKAAGEIKRKYKGTERTEVLQLLKSLLRKSRKSE